MNLAEMLGYADIKQLSRIAEAYSCECSGHSKHELIQSILMAVGRKDLFDQQIEQLTLEDLRFINSLLFDSRSAFSLEELVARASSCRFDHSSASATGQTAEQRGEEEAPVVTAAKSRSASGRKSKTSSRKRTAEAAEPQPEAGPRAMITKLKQAGWLFNGYSGTSRYLFHVPSDLKTRFAESLCRKFKQSIQHTGEPAIYRDEQSLIMEDLVQMLKFIRQQDIPLSMDGSMYKRSVQQFLELFAVTEELPAKGAWRFGYGRRFKDYPDRMALLYDFCYYKRWIEEEQSVLRLTAAGEDVLSSISTLNQQELYRFWLRLYKSAVPSISSIVEWISRLSQQWVTLNSIRAVLLPYVKPFYYDDAQTVFDKRIVTMLLHLGLIRVGEDEAHGTVIRMTTSGRSMAAGIALGEHDNIVLH